MKITEGQLRRIIREELNEMRGVTISVDPAVAAYIKKHFVPGVPLVLPAHLAGKVVELSTSETEDFPSSGAEMARAVGGARAGGSPVPANLKQDIYEKLSKHGGMTERGILMSLSAKYGPALIKAALFDMEDDGYIDQDERGVYHIAGYEEYADPGEDY